MGILKDNRRRIVWIAGTVPKRTAEQQTDRNTKESKIRRKKQNGMLDIFLKN
jgi:hypothetical protein